MRVGRVLVVLTTLLLIGVGLGHLSGNQPRRDSVAAAEAELGLSLESRRVDVGDVTLHVVLAGPESGPPVVLLHGFPEFWYSLYPLWSGTITRKPSDTPTRSTDSSFSTRHIRSQWKASRARKTPSAGTGPSSYCRGWSARVGNWALLVNSLRDTAQPGTFPDAAMDQFRSAWDNDGAIHSMGDWYRAASRFGRPAEGELRVATPTLVLVAPDDVFIPGDLTRRSLAFLDQGEMRELDRGSHWVIQEDPALIGGLLVEFFSRPEGAQASPRFIAPPDR